MLGIANSIIVLSTCNSAAPSKRSMLEKQMNFQIMLMFAVEGSVCLVSSIISGVFRGTTVEDSWYLDTPFSAPITGVLSYVITINYAF